MTTAYPLALFPYQEEAGVVLSGHERYGLFDEPGVGKTATLIGVTNELRAQRIMVVCPAAVREVWVGEFKKFAKAPRRVVKGRTIHDLNLWLRGRADVLITSYELATKWAKYIDDIFDVLIFDEAHYLKSPIAQRTRAMLGTYCQGENGLARWAARVYFATGTPAPNDPIDVWPFLRFTGATSLNLNAFTSRYFKSTMGTFSARQEPRKETVGELRDMIARVSIRRTKRDVGLQIPPIWLTTQTVDGDTDEIRELLRSHDGLETAILEAVERGGLSLLDAPHVATLRRLVGEAKAPAFGNLLVEELQSGLDKVVCMGVHTRALHLVRDACERAGHKCVMITGETPEGQRMKAVQDFQNDPDTRVFIGNVRAAGTGLTLTAAAEVIMLESSWTPADNAQAIMRVHRVGQERKVRARFISLSGSIDEMVSETVARKTAAIASLGIEIAIDPV